METNVQPQRRVVCAATRFRLMGTDTKLVVCSPRHFDQVARETLCAMGNSEYMIQDQQGFVDQFGVFMSRADAWVVAQAAGQIIRLVGGQSEGEANALYSENLY